jgi:hypothetical protein
MKPPAISRYPVHAVIFRAYRERSQDYLWPHLRNKTMRMLRLEDTQDFH